jgi:hypothetical protein
MCFPFPKMCVMIKIVKDKVRKKLLKALLGYDRDETRSHFILFGK